MHASGIVTGFIEAHLAPIHGARRSVLSAVVIAALSGHCVSLTRLARGVMGSRCLKSALKQVDRFIGHRRIDNEARIVGRELLARLCQWGWPLIIAVDWTEVSPGAKFVKLRAAVTRLGMGRALTVYQQVYALKKLGNAKAERLLLQTLRAWVEPGRASHRDHGRGLSPALVCAGRAHGLVVDWTGASRRECLVRWPALDQRGAVHGLRQEQGAALELVLPE